MSAGPDILLLVFLLLCAGLLLPPFIPAWREWLRPTDRQVLRMAVGDDNQASLLRLLRQQMATLLGSGDPLAYESLEQALVRGVEPQAPGPQRPVFVSRTSHADHGIQSRWPVYAADDLQLRESSDLTDVLADGHLVLGPRSRVRGWAHAEKTLLLGESSVVARDLSSEHGVSLAWACCFERVQAPVIVFGQPGTRDHRSRPALPPHEPLPGARPWGRQGWRIEGDCVIQKGRHFTGSLVVTGVLSIGADALVEGDVKAHKGVVIGERAHVTGGVFSDNGIRVFNEAVIGGPLVSESLLQLGAGVHLGSLRAPTSVSANVILADNGVLAHGSVCAAQAGLVWGTT
ncbi:hypothetical protein [Hydrogenophaga sp. ZJX-1]|uniref:hypothetical protein n=1 Tax=Hydrogenophaga sp. ZJX-1 TaxID=3404778 RepID=UPI003B28390C